MRLRALLHPPVDSDDAPEDKTLYKCGGPLEGDAVTNNEAEYHGLLQGLRALAQITGNPELKAFDLLVQGDSELVIKQCAGAYECRAPNLLPLLA